MRLLLSALILAITMSPVPALASLCYAFVEDLRRTLPGVQYAQIGPVDAHIRSVKITYVSHSTFRIETAEGVTIATDFYGTAGYDDGEAIIPDVVTMNHAHTTHWTATPDERISYVLRGWDHDGEGPADYKLRVRDVTIRNVTTDIRGWGVPEKDGNSIFIFEVADLCIGHLGHLHHELTEQHYARVGRLDVVMAPVDGGMTLDIPSMIRVLKTLKARLVLPMHAWSDWSMRQFLSGMSDEFQIQVHDGRSIEVAFNTLPKEPTVLFMPTGELGGDPSFGID